MANRRLADADAEIAALKAQLAAAGQGPASDAVVQRYPCVMYKAHKVDTKHPNGYERRRVQETDTKGELDVEKCEALVAQLEAQGWLHSPETLAV